MHFNTCYGIRIHDRAWLLKTANVSAHNSALYRCYIAKVLHI